MATHSSVFARRIPGMGEPGGLPSVGSHRVGHDWSDLAAVAAYVENDSKLILSGFISLVYLLVFSIIITGVDCHRFRVEFEVNAPLKIQKRYNLILYFYVLYSFLSLIKSLNSLPQST